MINKKTNLNNYKKKIYIIISNTLGELDVILPILVVLNKKNKFKIKIVFTVNNIYQQLTIACEFKSGRISLGFNGYIPLGTKNKSISQSQSELGHFTFSI